MPPPGKVRLPQGKLYGTTPLAPGTARPPLLSDVEPWVFQHPGLSLVNGIQDVQGSGGEGGSLLAVFSLLFSSYRAPRGTRGRLSWHLFGLLYCTVSRDAVEAKVSPTLATST